MYGRARSRSRGATLTALLCAATAAAAEPQNDDSLFDMPLDQLLDLVVSASARSQPLREAPASIHLITAEQIAARGYYTLEDALHDLPGIDFVHVGGAFPTIFAPRGAWGDENRRILLMIDGVVENSLNGGFELGGPAYSLFGVERIEVIFGPASALYGANAFSGIVNLISRVPGKTRVVRYRRLAGSDDAQRDDIHYSAPLGHDLSLSVSATRLRSDGPQLDRVIDGYADGYVDDAIGWNLRLRHAGERQRTTLGAHGTDTSMGNGTFGNTPTAFLGLPPRSPDNPGAGGFYHGSLDGEPPGRWHPYTQNAFLEHQRELGARWQGKLRLSYRRNGLRDDSYSYSVNRTATALSRFHGAYDSDRWGSEVQAAYAHADGGNTTVGWNYYRDDLERGYRLVQPDPAIVVVDGIPLTNVNARFLPRSAVRSYDTGVFVEHQRRAALLGETELTLGARFDRNRLYGESFNPRLGLVNHPAEHWVLKLLYGSAYRAPTPFELFSTSPVRVANPDLQPERVRSTEFALTYQAGAHELQVTVFDNRLQDLIVEGIPVGNGQTQIQNAARARVQGLTAGWQYRFAERGSLWANLTWQDAEQMDGNGRSPIANVARFKANLGGQWQFAANSQLHLVGRWVGDRSVVVSNPLDEVAGYFVADLHLSSRPWANQAISVSASVRNLADRRYTDPGIRQASGSSFSPQLEQPGRTVWLGIQLEL